MDHEAGCPKGATKQCPVHNPNTTTTCQIANKNQPKKLPNRKAVRLSMSGGEGRYYDRQQRYGGADLPGSQTTQHFVITLFQNLKRVAEALLRWAFFTLNLFMLALYICQNWALWLVFSLLLQRSTIEDNCSENECQYQVGDSHRMPYIQTLRKHKYPRIKYTNELRRYS